MKNEKVEVAVGKKYQRTHLTLPKEVADHLLALKQPLRKVYASKLVEEGWTYRSIADVVGVTRQAIDISIRTIRDYEEGYLRAEISHLPVPKLPSKVVYKEVPKQPSIEVVEVLKDLHSKAKLVRSNSPLYRQEAEDFTRLAWEQIQDGISIYTLSKALGLSQGALQFRFVRYGLIESKGTSRSYNKIKNRKEN